MKKIIVCILLTLFIIPFISAGSIIITPNPVEGGNKINITMYATPSDPMDCSGVIKVSGKTTVVGFIEFACDTHCRCYSTVSTSFLVNESLKGDYQASVWDYLSGDFTRGGFTVIPYQNKCLNGIKDGNESDIDCGGDECGKCIDEKNCLNNDDCSSGYCDFDNKCRKINIVNSTRNMDKYSKQEAFIVSDENYQEVLKLVPLSVWYENSKKINFPVLIYHNESSKFDFDSGIHFLQLYSPNHITVFGETPEKLDKLLISNGDVSQETIRNNAGKYLGAGLNKEQISKISFNDYYSYWNQINNVVVSSDDYETGLMASVFASNKNAPLMFEDEISYGVLAGKKVYVVGNIDNKVLTNIKKIANETVVYNNKEVQKEYIKSTSSDKVIVVNANDLGIKLDKNFRTDKSSNIKEIYSKNSLAAGFLAAIRDEVIINVNATGSPDNSDCNNNSIISNNFNLINDSIKNQIEGLDWKPEYLTIFASPNSIPDSIYRKCHESGYQFRNSSDYDYASFGNETLKFGRIYGIDAGDASSYVARDIFYEQISKDLYENNSTGFSIGHSFDNHMDNAQEIKNASVNSGYDSVCYTGEGREGCITKYNPPASEYSKKQFITFGDHGFPDQWADTLKSSKVPALDLSYVFSHACSTSNFWEGGENLMSIKMIRKGAISYQGAVGVSYADNSEFDALKKLTSSNITLGELNKELANDSLFYKRDYIMIGDPVFQPGLRNIDWANFSSGSESNESEGVEVGGLGTGNIISLDSEKSDYFPGDKILIKTKVKNEENTSEKLYLEYDIFSEEEKYDSELVLQKIELEPDSEKEFNFSMEVSETMPSGNYKAVVRLLNGENGEDELDKKEVLFNVNGTSKTMDLILKSCEDKDCNSEAKVFGKNETIYLDYENSVDADINALLVYPNGTENEISLPYNFSSDNEGNYRLSVNASKSGYQDFEDEIIFGVSSDANISVEETCNSNKVCDNNETIQNCPQDCISINFPEENNSEISCYNDSGCDDNNTLTSDICINPRTIDSYCVNHKLDFVNITEVLFNNAELSPESINYFEGIQHNVPIEIIFDSNKNIEDMVKIRIYIENISDTMQYNTLGTPLLQGVKGYATRFTMNTENLTSGEYNFIVEIYTKDESVEETYKLSIIKYECLVDSDCDDDNIFTEDHCIDPGTENSSCSNLPITCFNSGDCGNDYWFRDFFCNLNNVFDNYLVYTCNDPGSVLSSCSSNVMPKLNQTCSSNQLCSLGVCQNITCFNDNQCDDGKDNTFDRCDKNGTLNSICAYINVTCVDDSWCNDNNIHTEDHCNYPRQLNSSCFNLPIKCLNYSECGDNNYINAPFCQENNIFRDYITYTCNNNGTSNSFCSNSTTIREIGNCTSNQLCSDGECKNKIENRVYGNPDYNFSEYDNQNTRGESIRDSKPLIYTIANKSDEKFSINLNQINLKKVNPDIKVNILYLIIIIFAILYLILIIALVMVIKNR